MESLFIIVPLGFIFLIAWLIGKFIDIYKKAISKVNNIEEKVTNIENILKKSNSSNNNLDWLLPPHYRYFKES